MFVRIATLAAIMATLSIPAMANTVTAVSGSVQVNTGGGWQPARANATLPANAQVRVNSGRVMIRLSSGQCATLSAGTHSLSSVRGSACGGASLASAMGTGMANTSIASVAGARANDAAERQNPVNVLLDTMNAEAEAAEQAAMADARTALDGGDTEGAISGLAAFLAQNQDASEAHHMISGLYLEQGQFEDAIPHLVYITEEPRGVDRELPYFRLALAYQSLGMSEEADQAVEDALSNFSSTENRGRLLLIRSLANHDMGNNDAARLYANQAAQFAMSEVIEAVQRQAGDDAETFSVQALAEDETTAAIMAEQEFILSQRLLILQQIGN